MASERVAFVTGGTGFVGRQLVRHLVASGWHVRSLVRSPVRSLVRSGEYGQEREQATARASIVETVVGDLDDVAALRAGMQAADVVFHLAAVTSSADRRQYTRVNVSGTRNVVNAMLDVAPRARLVHCSSLAAAGPAGGDHPILESDAPAPVSRYGESKLEAERVVRSAVESAGLDAIVLRPSAVYGPGDHDILAAFRLARHGLAARVAPRDQVLSMLHVTDLADALLLAAGAPRRPSVPPCYNLSDGAAYPVDAVMAAIASAVGRSVRTIPVPRIAALGIAAVDVALSRATHRKPLLTPGRIAELRCHDWRCDITRARGELGFSPRVGLVDGMRETAQWYHDHGWL